MGMNFYFLDKNDFEKDIIVDVLSDNHIKNKVITKQEIFYLDNNKEEEETDYLDEAYIISYDIMLIDISLETFDYMKYLVDKKTSLVVKLNRCLKKRIRKKDKNKIEVRDKKG